MILMNKNEPVAILDYIDSTPTGYKKIINDNGIPLGTKGLNEEQEKILFTHWYKSRSIPNIRPNLTKIEQKLGMDIAEALSKSMNISITDTYWVKEEDSLATWEDINYHDNGFDMVLAKYYADEDILFSPSPDFTTDGVMEKFWYTSCNIPYLAKIDNKYGNRLSANEIVYFQIAANVGIQSTPYVSGILNNQNYCACPCFISNSNENYVSAMQVKHSDFSLTSENLIKYFSNKLGFEKEIKEMITLDCLFHNTDRHEKNFGYIVKEDGSLQFVPMFDNGFCLGVNRDINNAVTDGDMKLFNDKRIYILKRYGVPLDIDKNDCLHILQSIYEKFGINESLYESAKRDLDFGLNLIAELNKSYLIENENISEFEL